MIPTLKLFITVFGKKRKPLPVPKVKLLVIRDDVKIFELKKFCEIPVIVEPS